ncbi:hypothetical protein E3T46_03260 [Cryobacterium sp. Hh11]|uniref:hypothetical protein n=1 Tax=Cryobacterium sp. Hh11 TaxID=2555868 RepID=UPI00106D2813|nr:hypothetical protein [Cryobacterium sp. Hh11]TFD53527.1 hypothetical protein E3T46_03260 [Cryobacterium sp. Hh11]
MISRKFNELPQWSFNIFAAVGFLFWGVVGIWGVVVAFAGGTYPWPFNQWTSGGGNLIPAIGFFLLGGVATALTGAVGAILGWLLRLILRTTQLLRN